MTFVITSIWIDQFVYQCQLWWFYMRISCWNLGLCYRKHRDGLLLCVFCFFLISWLRFKWCDSKVFRWWAHNFIFCVMIVVWVFGSFPFLNFKFWLVQAVVNMYILIENILILCLVAGITWRQEKNMFFC